MRGQDLTPSMVRYAYENGSFPMAEPDGTILWYQPYRRCLFPIEGIHVSRSLSRTIRRGGFEIRYDTAFEEVMRSCLRPVGNWISPDLMRVYTQIHFDGWGHSCEVWMDGELVGGVYGVAVGGCFSAESMFHRRTDMSKIALWALVDKCRELGFTLFDAQVTNPHLQSLGSYEIPQRRFVEQLRKCLGSASPWDPLASRSGYSLPPYSSSSRPETEF
ncbi:MAG: leucyl/phenylalanyl-tRNA--protein transferase [Fimbriimonadaceae bacterium]